MILETPPFCANTTQQNRVMNAPDRHRVSYLVIIRIIRKFSTLLRMIYRLTIATVTVCSQDWLVLATSASHIKLEPEVFREDIPRALF